MVPAPGELMLFSVFMGTHVWHTTAIHTNLEDKNEYSKKSTWALR